MLRGLSDIIDPVGGEFSVILFKLFKFTIKKYFNNRNIKLFLIFGKELFTNDIFCIINNFRTISTKTRLDCRGKLEIPIKLYTIKM